MPSGKPLVMPDEWNKWAKYFGGLFPCATAEWIEKMCQRMMRTLMTDETTRMSREDYLARLRQFRDSLDALPPDPHNKLMGAE